MNSFDQKLQEHNLQLKKTNIDILQVNLGKLCNLTCFHCHVEAGPTKTEENMNRETAEAVVRFMDQNKIKILDLTGGAPEMNASFRYLVTEARRRGVHVIDRCNLTILFEPGQEDLADFLAEYNVEIVASLPCYSQDNVDKQRGDGTFDGSIKGLKLLNSLGYGRYEGKLLNLVYNPVGPHLPPEQTKLELEYKKRLKNDFGIEFNQLYTIANMPITRYAKYLKAFDQYHDYVDLLHNHFNASTVSGLMCINTLSVGWDGAIYDCDFNQMLEMPVLSEKRTIFDVTSKDLEGANVLTADHCFGCTAGAGSSCQGALK